MIMFTFSSDEDMAVAASKRPRAATVQKEAVDQVGTFLQDLPEKPKETFSLREAVSRLRDQIQAALAKGYSYDDLAAMLTKQGVEISASTLKNYVPSGKRQAAKEQAAPTKPRGRRGRKPQSEEQAILESAAALSEAASSPAENGSAPTLPSNVQELSPAEPEAPAPAEEAPAPAKRGRGRAKGSTAAKTKSQSKTKSDAEPAEKATSTRPRSRGASKTSGTAAAKPATRGTRGRKKST